MHFSTTVRKHCWKLNEKSFKRRLNKSRISNLTSETFQRSSTNTTEEARLHVSICRFWITDKVCFSDVILQDICSMNCSSTKQTFKIEKNAYIVKNVQYDLFKPPVCWIGFLILASFQPFDWCISVKSKYECNTIINTIIA